MKICAPEFAARIAEEHQEQAVRRPGRAFIVEALGQDALARAVRLHHADRELALRLLGEGDEIAARRPDRRRIGPFAKRDALRLSAGSRHDIELLGAAAVGIEHDLRAVGRIGRRRVDRIGVRKPRRRARAQIHRVEIGRAALRQRHDDLLPVRRKARREGHAREIADDFALAGFDVEQQNLADRVLPKDI